jgi:hypothetical protein
MVRPEGFEPTTRRVETGCSIPLSYGRVARRERLELSTSGFEARRSNPLSYRRIGVTYAGVCGWWSARLDSNQRPLASKARTLTRLSYAQWSWVAAMGRLA